MLTRSPYWDYTELEPIRVQFQVDTANVPALRKHLADQLAIIHDAIARNRRSYLIISAPGVHRPTPDVRKLQAEWLEENREAIAASSIGMSFVIDSSLVRGALTAIFWLSRPPIAYKVHPTLREALECGVETCKQHGLALPEEALRPDAAERADLALARVLNRRIAL